MYYTIKQMAEMFDVTEHALRFYTDEGLLPCERGKRFIGYISAENAWNPIAADGYMYIDCQWVAGSFKGHGYGAEPLNFCINDSKQKGKAGLCILSSAKKTVSCRSEVFAALRLCRLR